MADVHSLAIRSKNMSAIKSADTKPELLLRKLLHKAGFRYTLNNKHLPGKPDLVFPKYNAVVFANGCFWHKHSCHLFQWPATRKKFWENKINGNAERDKKIIKSLIQTGWRVCIVWECSLKGKKKLNLDRIDLLVSKWLKSDIKKLTVKCKS